MNKQEELWNKFKDLEFKVAHIKYAIQNPIDEFPLREEYVEHWVGTSNDVAQQLTNLVLETYTFIEENNSAL